MPLRGSLYLSFMTPSGILYATIYVEFLSSFSIPFLQEPFSLNKLHQNPFFKVYSAFLMLRCSLFSMTEELSWQRAYISSLYVWVIMSISEAFEFLSQFFSTEMIALSLKQLLISWFFMMKNVSMQMISRDVPQCYSELFLVLWLRRVQKKLAIFWLNSEVTETFDLMSLRRAMDFALIY